MQILIKCEQIQITKVLTDFNLSIALFASAWYAYILPHCTLQNLQNCAVLNAKCPALKALKLYWRKWHYRSIMLILLLCWGFCTDSAAAFVFIRHYSNIVNLQSEMQGNYLNMRQVPRRSLNCNMFSELDQSDENTRFIKMPIIAFLSSVTMHKTLEMTTLKKRIS